MSATDRAYDVVRENIVSGRLAPGSRLPEDELAALSGVSRTPVREALRRLQAEGFVEFRSNRGARVASWTQDDIDDLYGLRGLLESYAAMLAAERIDDEALEELDALAAEMKQLAENPDHDTIDAVAALNGRFHQLMITASRSARLEQLMTMVVQVPLVHRTFHQYSPPGLARSMNHHVELAAALRSRDGQWASAVMHAHVLAARNELKALERGSLEAMAESPAQAATAGDGTGSR
ncbi:MAG: FCD domain-containing protein [Actinobacteria bacterium]|nr:FCD domain-containing protein [Actinomycetota bacterium]